MTLFFTACCFLILGYIFYGAFVEKVFGANENKKTPAVRYNDGVDYVVLPPYKIFLIQFLNIAGLGPVFGALMGIIYGPVALIWIVFGCVFAGAVHDYLSGMISLRYRGQSLVFLIEKFFGTKFKFLFMLFLGFFLVMVGAVFAMNPAAMLSDVFKAKFIYLIIFIFGYYFLATLLPVDKIIGRFYPFFAVLLIGVTGSLIVALFLSDLTFYQDITFSSQHPQGQSFFPIMFVTIACGAISGFHATQSPMMAKCIKNEKYGRPIFYGAMITEGFVALIWATLGIAFYQNSESLSAVLSSVGPGGAIKEISSSLLGKIGGNLALISVVVLSITSGDTAFRSARLIFSECFNLSQKKFKMRLMVSIFVLSVGIFLSFFDLTFIWTYFGWANQILATVTLFVCSVYLREKKKNYWIALIPALFMSVICFCYILNQKIGFNMSLGFSSVLSLLLTSIFLIIFFNGKKKIKKS
ncbi:MAG: carbon starvation protein A [Alphaproteobacteria bacterium]|nr:carbon starvation protein A [Alphaproteobacteria bacterium]